MNLDLSEDQDALHDAIARLAADHLAAAGSADPTAAFWADFGQAGWLALPLPERRGGAGGSLGDCGAVLQAIGRHGMATPFLSGWVVAGRALARACDDSGRQDIFDGLVTGERTLAFAHGEQERFDPTTLTTAATPEGDGWRIAGAKAAVLGGAGAEHFIVSAAQQEDGPLLALIPADARGLHRRAFRTWRGEDAADLELDCQIAPDQVLARGPKARTLIAETVREAVIASCWEAVGMMRALLADTIEHVKNRQQFGKPLSKQQVVRHRIAEMSVYCEEAQALVRGATLRTEAGDGERAASAAKVKLVEASRYVARQAVQLHGGMGVTEESRVSALFRKLTAFENLYGSPAEHVARYGDAVIASRRHIASAVLP